MVKRISKMNSIILIVILFMLIIFTGTLMVLFQNGANVRITLATTTSTDNSGLLDYLHQQMELEININVDVVAVGTGAALEYAKRGLADVVIVHARNLEDQFIKDGFATHRIDLMYNDFIIVGPTSDPANISGITNSTELFNRLYQSKDEIQFISRGDNSGTHVKELELWTSSGININSNNYEWANVNPWYLESGSGMGQTLTIASISNAYTLVDRGTWLFLKNNTNLILLAEGANSWFNSYGALLVNPANGDIEDNNFNSAKTYVKWLISPKGQNLINSYKIEGEQAFHANFNDHIDEMSQESKDFWGIQNSLSKLSAYPVILTNYRINWNLL